MNKNLKNFIIGSILWVIYGLIVIGISDLLANVIWYSGLIGYSNLMYNVITIVAGIIMLIPGYMGYWSKINGKYFIKEGLI